MLFKNKIYLIGSALSALVFLYSCDKNWDDHYNTVDESSQKNKVVAELEKIPDVSDFTAAVKSIDTLVDLLNQNRLYTVFAPVNESFNQIDEEILNNEVLFTRMVIHHFIDGKYKYRDFENDVLTTFSDKYLQVSVDGSNKVLLDNNSSILQEDFLSQNGMIQVIDKPLIPLNNLNEFFIYNSYTDLLGQAIPMYTIKEFLINESTPIAIDENDQVIYDSVFLVTNPFLYEGPYYSDEMYGNEFTFTNIANENALYTFVFPTNYATALADVKNSPFLNASIADQDWAGPILTNNLLRAVMPKDLLIQAFDDYHTKPDIDTLYIWYYFNELLKNNFVESDDLSNGIVHLVDGFEYDMSWLITDQAGMEEDEKDNSYLKDLEAVTTASDNVDSIFISLKNVKTVFYDSEDSTGFETKYGEWVNFDLEGDFYPVDYRILVRGKNFASGTFQIEADGKAIGEYNFANAPSGDLDTQFDEIGIVSFTETKKATNLKFTFVNTHPEANTNEQFLWVREIKLAPILK